MPRTDGASLHELITSERVTYAAAVPTVWLGLLEHLRQTGGRLDGLERICVGGAACPQLLLETFGDEYGVRVNQGWGMTEMSPVGAYNSPKPGHGELSGPASYPTPPQAGPADVRRRRSGSSTPTGAELPWDGATPGELVAKGPWVCRGYYREDGDADRRRRAGCTPATSPPSTRTASSRSPTAPRT